MNSQLESIMESFTFVGFDFHEVEWARKVSEPLGSRFCGDVGRVGPKSEKAWLLKLSNGLAEEAVSPVSN